jgi:hypothetical protein
LPLGFFCVKRVIAWAFPEAEGVIDGGGVAFCNAVGPYS